MGEVRRPIVRDKWENNEDRVPGWADGQSLKSRARAGWVNNEYQIMRRKSISISKWRDTHRSTICGSQYKRAIKEGSKIILHMRFHTRLRARTLILITSHFLCNLQSPIRFVTPIHSIKFTSSIQDYLIHCFIRESNF